ncbi:MAG: peptide chain release factor N(5)-glutamine methyltransferase [Deltaproteobacteria bacterium]|nr:peptide chain release factor N(5)-glutamine methyltransferase [Deltaproteobacteria bacterium]
MLVEEALECLDPERSGGRGVDIGTGSGAIPIALLRERPTLSMDAVDLSVEALEVADRNARRHGVGERIRFLHGHLDEPVRGEPPYDLVTANLPYIPTDEVATLPTGVRDFEPRLALDGGADGLGLLASLMARADSLLAPGGAMVLEVGIGQAAALSRMAETSSLGPARVRKDYSGNERVVVLRRR